MPRARTQRENKRGRRRDRTCNDKTEEREQWEQVQDDRVDVNERSQRVHGPNENKMSRREQWRGWLRIDGLNS